METSRRPNKRRKVVQPEEQEQLKYTVNLKVNNILMNQNHSVLKALVENALTLRTHLNKLTFKGTSRDPITHVYNPLEYAWEPHLAYLSRYATKNPKLMLVGMNPGPWGMSQTGVPFGEITSVRDFLKISADLPIGKPGKENPKRKIEGFMCTKSEVSGKRLWGFMARRFNGSAEDMSITSFVFNYCPLAFMGSSGVNVTPDKLPGNERKKLFELCDESLRQAMVAVQPDIVCGVGVFTGEVCLRLFGDRDSLKIGILQHPSPAGPGGRIWESAENFDELILRPKKIFNGKAMKKKPAVDESQNLVPMHLRLCQELECLLTRNPAS